MATFCRMHGSKATVEIPTGQSRMGTTGMTSLSCPCQAGSMQTPETG